MNFKFKPQMQSIKIKNNRFDFLFNTIFIISLAGCSNQILNSNAIKINNQPQSNAFYSPPSDNIYYNRTSNLPACKTEKAQERHECFGLTAYDSGHRYAGEWRHGKRFGLGIEYNIIGSVLRSGYWEDDDLLVSSKLNHNEFPFGQEDFDKIILFSRKEKYWLDESKQRIKIAIANSRDSGLSWKSLVDNTVDAELRKWLYADSYGLEVVPPPKYPAALSLKQEIWETNKEFEARVEKARHDRWQIIEKIQEEYRTKVEDRNRRVEAFNKIRSERETALPAMRSTLIQTALKHVTPDINLSDVVFNQQTGAISLAVKVEGLDKKTFAFTGTAQALRRTFLTEPQSLHARPEFEVSEAGDIFLKAVTVELGGVSARGVPSSGEPAPLQLAAITLPEPVAPTVSQQSAVTVDRNQVEQILYRDENELLRKRLEEQRRQQEQAIALAEARAAAENARLRAEVEALRNQPGSPRLPQNLAKVNEAHALVIGNSAYSGSNRLANPVNDARAMSAKLRSLGFKVTEIRDAGRAQMVRGLAEFSRTAERADLTLLFYAGHGVQIAGTNYMIPVDTSLSDAGQAALQAVPLNQAVEQYLPGKTKLVFLDACRDNPLMASASRGIAKGLAPISVSEGTLIAYATKDGKTAEDGTGQTNSPFTAALLEHLADPDDIAVVLRTVRSKVMQRTNNRQQPWEYGSLTGGALVLSAIRR